MADRQLKDKAIKFKGSDYVQVKDRIQFLADNYEWQYMIETSYNWFPDEKMRVVRATLTIGTCRYTWLAQEIEWQWYINKTSALENAETSAVGRACAMAWIGVIDSIASIDEINKAENRRSKPKFTLDDFNRFKEKKAWEFSNYQEAKTYIEQYFTLGKDLYWKVMDLYGSSEDESQELMF